MSGADRNGCGSTRGRAAEAATSGVSLAEVLPEVRFVGCDDIVAARLTADVRRVEPGDVFVARLTGRGDGHEQVARAIRRGAAAIVAERIVPTGGVPLAIVPDSAWAHARLAHARHGDPATHLRLVAVTGTSGKTTTAWLTAAVLSEAGVRVGVLSDLGCLDAEAAAPEPADLADPDIFAGWLRRLVDSGCTHAVVEVSARMLLEQALAGVACRSMVVTNLAPVRRGGHEAVRASRMVRERILAALAPDGCLVVNADDPRASRLGARHPGPRLTAGLRAAADVTAAPVERSLAGQTVLVSAGSHVAATAIDRPTAAFARDALFAAAVGLAHRMPLERVTRGLEAAGGVPGRLERIDRGQDAAVFVDHPSTGHALAATLTSLRHLTPGRLVVIADERAVARLGPASRFVRRAARWCDATLVVPATVLDPDADSDAVSAYARIDRLLETAGPDDCVLVLGQPVGGGVPGDPGDPVAVGSLAALVDGWLELAHPPMWRGDRAA